MPQKGNPGCATGRSTSFTAFKDFDDSRNRGQNSGWKTCCLFPRCYSYHHWLLNHHHFIVSRCDCHKFWSITKMFCMTLKRHSWESEVFVCSQCDFIVYYVMYIDVGNWAWRQLPAPTVPLRYATGNFRHKNNHCAVHTSATGDFRRVAANMARRDGSSGRGI